jgi:hypothetical protein
MGLGGCWEMGVVDTYTLALGDMDLGRFGEDTE